MDSLIPESHTLAGQDNSGLFRNKIQGGGEVNITAYKKSKKGVIIMLRKENNKNYPDLKRIRRFERTIAGCNEKIRMLKAKRIK